MLEAGEYAEYVGGEGSEALLLPRFFYVRGRMWALELLPLEELRVGVLVAECVNESLIRSSFLPDEAALILSIPCSLSKSENSLTWNYKKLGSYSVRSGYHLGCDLLKNASMSGLSGSESWWQFLWHIKVPAKVKTLVVRSMCPLIKGFQADDHLNFMDFMVACKSQLVAEEMQLLYVVFLHVWFRRNMKVHNSRLLIDRDVVP
ncbi:hypothetical protein Dsin_002498 [Dipteronia sinensis]|uniref:Uncharacterized protein n=1 Tax=Dipteronia sinensis TaxID=43782 RepID=A0AAE0EK12_9ROSI|nr:hypothetical protein Dsin_002498 [Dipteronia sinensis]